MQDRLRIQSLAALHITDSPEAAQVTDMSPLVRVGGGGNPHPLWLTQGATLSSRLRFPTD